MLDEPADELFEVRPEVVIVPSKLEIVLFLDCYNSLISKENASTNIK
jgi:hypothetical protein